MSRCKTCDGTGFTESYHGGANSWTPSIQQCRERCNITGYSNEIQRRLNNTNYVTQSPVLMAKPSERPKLQVVSDHG